MFSPFIACSIVLALGFPSRELVPTTPAERRVRSGPLATRNGRAVALPFLRFVPRVDFLEKGEESLETGIQVINDVRRWPQNVGLPAQLEEDAETQRLSITYSRGIGHDTELSAEVPVLFRNGGFMDPIIDWWHAAILGPSFRVRDQLPRGRSTIQLPGAGPFGSAGGLGDISLFARKKVLPNLIAAVGLKLPTGDNRKLLGSGAFDAGFNLEYRKELDRRFQFDASIGFVIQGRAPTLRSARGLVDQEMLALTFRQNSRDSWIAQWQSEAAAVQTGVSPADAAHRMLTFGYMRRFSNRERLELYFSEDLDLLPGAEPIVNLAPDFTIGIRWVQRL